MPDAVPVAVIGATGYTGVEILRYLLAHPSVRVAAVVARQAAGRPLGEAVPSLFGSAGELTCEALDVDDIAGRAEAFLTCLPHGASQGVVNDLRERGRTVLDLSADHRLGDLDLHQRVHGEHAHPDRLGEAIYGLPELFRERLKGARLVGVPGCYPTAATLALWPAVSGGLIDPTDLIVDAKGGVSGAGKSPGPATHFPECGEGITAYKVLEHRHGPEIERALSVATGVDVRVLFTPHLVPMSRGILCTAYGRLVDGVDPDAVRPAYERAYGDEAFVHLLPPGTVPHTRDVRGSNQARVSVHVDAASRRVVLISAIDNLGKGAAGQAVQCLNLSLGLDEGLGLQGAPLYP